MLLIVSCVIRIVVWRHTECDVMSYKMWCDVIRILVWRHILRLTSLFIFNCFKRKEICHLVVLPNKFAFEENKLINLGIVVSITVCLYFVNSLKCFFIYHSRSIDFLLSLFRIRVISLWLFRGHWFYSINDGKHNQN